MQTNSSRSIRCRSTSVKEDHHTGTRVHRLGAAGRNATSIRTTHHNAYRSLLVAPRFFYRLPLRRSLLLGVRDVPKFKSTKGPFWSPSSDDLSLVSEPTTEGPLAPTQSDSRQNADFQVTLARGNVRQPKWSPL
jgi:hypothetical protein